MRHHLPLNKKIIYQDKVLEVLNFWTCKGKYYEFEVKEHIRIRGMNLTEQHPNIMFEDLKLNGYTKLK